MSIRRRRLLKRREKKKKIGGGGGEIEERGKGEKIKERYKEGKEIRIEENKRKGKN
jgi:hypothetical protein